MRPVVLAIGGSDPSAGAGVQADLKTIHALGGYALTGVTSVTAQDSDAVGLVHDLPPEVVGAQLEMLLRDFPVAAFKTGMLGNGRIVSLVADIVAGRGLPLVVDPVLASTGGRSLLDEAGFEQLVKKLLPLATLCTPNWSEAQALAGRPVRTTEEAIQAAQMIRERGVEAVLVTGGHAPGEESIDLLVSGVGVRSFRAPRISGPTGTMRSVAGGPGRSAMDAAGGGGVDAHGTGCILAAAIACGLAAGMPLEGAIERAKQYVSAAIRSALLLGQKRPILDHFHENDPPRCREEAGPDPRS
ncbi:MAG: hydroxymethylpyrimidine/phosphomethylpyrimidine kinase [Candidatus Eisenbacteria bacterium]